MKNDGYIDFRKRHSFVLKHDKKNQDKNEKKGCCHKK